MAITVSALADYPVKSLAGRSLDRLAIGELGPEGDRRWMVVDAGGRFVTQRECARMCLIAASPGAGELRLRAPGTAELTVPVPSQRDAAAVAVTVWGDTVEALDAGDAAAHWLSGFLGRPLRLCYMPAAAARRVAPAYASAADRVGFADGFPFLLVSESSLAHVCRTLGRDIAVRRFRPNIVIAGSEAFAEDRWRRIRIGGVEFDVAKPCSRCVIPAIDPDTGEKQREVLLGLRQYRREDGRIYFGQNLLHRGTGEIGRGDPVEIIR